MEINAHIIIASIINFTLLIGIIIVLDKALKGVKNFAKRNKELDKKVDIILSKLDKQNNN